MFVNFEFNVLPVAGLIKSDQHCSVRADGLEIFSKLPRNIDKNVEFFPFIPALIGFSNTFNAKILNLTMTTRLITE